MVSLLLLSLLMVFWGDTSFMHFAAAWSLLSVSFVTRFMTGVGFSSWVLLVWLKLRLGLSKGRLIERQRGVVIC